MHTQTKLTLGLAALCVAGWGLLLTRKDSVPTERIVTQEVVKYVDRVVTKDVVRTETRPDGTRIVTETKVDTKEHTSEQTKTKQVVTVTPNLSKYSLGINLRPESLFPFKGIYTVEVGKRLWETPIWVTASANTKKEFTVGLRVEF